MAFAAFPTLTTYTKLVATRTSPGEVLDALHHLTMEHFGISVLGAARLPFKNYDWVSVELGKNVFIQAKLGAHNRPHAVAEAIRHRLIV
jgi:hypothetical protein